VQMALVEEFESDHPVAQYLGTIDASNTNAQKGLEQHWGAPVSVQICRVHQIVCETRAVQGFCKPLLCKPSS
jgi:hypothetical protein